MTIRGKLGTHATAVYEVRGSTTPAVDDVIEVRSEMDRRVSGWTRVCVNQIKDIGGAFLFMELA
jgi:hypothetical protein